MTRLLSITLWLMFLCARIYGQETIIVADATDQYIFTFDDLVYLNDPEGKFTLDEIRQKHHQGEFTVNNLYSPHNPNTKHSYWIGIRIKGDTSSKKKWMLEIFDQTTDHIEAYVPQTDGTYKKIAMGDELPFAQR